MSRKKSESFLAETRKIEDCIVEVNRSNDIILDSISEEKYLIEMYTKVIE